MKTPKIMKALSFVDEDLLEEACGEKAPRKQPQKFWKPALAAACACFCAGALFWMKAFAPCRPELAEGGTDKSPEAGSPPMHYEGPILPLSALEENALSAERSILLDLAGDVPEPEGGLWVRDEYRLTNHTDADQTVNLIYPFCGDFKRSPWPAVRLQGQEISTQLIAGGYAGSFQGVPGAEQEGINLKEPESWEDYKTLLENADYFKEAKAAAPALEQPVTVYKIENFTGAQGQDAATLAMHFKADPQKTTLLTYGFNGMERDPETGNEIRSFFVREERGPRYLIAVGEDLAEYQLKGYQNGSCERGNELSGLTADVTRYPSTLGEVLKEAARQEYEKQAAGSDRHLAKEVSFETYFAAASKYFAKYGPLGSQPKQRYEEGELSVILSEAAVLPRVLYLQFPVMVAAGESVQVSVEMHKPTSYYYEWQDPAMAGVNSFELAGTLGSGISFASQRAELKIRKETEIIEQDFGFDPQNEVLERELDLNKDCWNLKVRSKQA